MTNLAQSAIAEIKRRMHVSAEKAKPKPKIQTVYQAIEAAEDEDFRKNWKDVKRKYKDFDRDL